MNTHFSMYTIACILLKYYEFGGNNSYLCFKYIDGFIKGIKLPFKFIIN